MRKKSTRLVSAALAVCMMLSVLPVGAFAAEPGEEPENGVSAQTSLPVIENSEIKSADTDQVIDKAGTYTMSGDYANRIIVNTDGDVTIKVTGNIKFTKEVTYGGGEIALWHVKKVGTLTIDNSGGFEVSTVPGSYTEVLREDYGAKATQINVNGGVYKGNKNCTFQFSSNGKVNMNNVTAEGDCNVIRANGGGDVTITNGKYEGLADWPVISGENGILNIYGGEYVGNGVVLFADKTVQMNINGAKVSGKAAIDVWKTGKATITDCIIKGSKRGIWAENDNVILNSATFENNESDIYLATGKTITIADTFTDTATVKCENAVSGRQITTNNTTGQEKLKLISNDVDANGKTYRVAYDKDGNFRYLTPRAENKYTVTAENATATTLDGTPLYSYDEIEAGKDVTLTADAPEDGWVFAGWQVTEGGLTLDDTADTVTFQMPTSDVVVSAQYEYVGTPDVTDDGSGDIAAGVVIGGIAAVGAYEVGTGLYRITQMDDVAMPTNRLALAKLLWERAGKPEPESTALYSDISAEDTDAQKAARWAVEQELLKDDTNEDEQKFHPAFPVSKLRVCLTWEKAKQKGLFDTAAE